MKEYKDESGRMVREWSFEDWENGWIDGQKTAGKSLPRRSDGLIDFLPKAEYDKIQEACKKQYEQGVEYEIGVLKDRFQNGIEKSLDKSRFIESEIHLCEYILFKSVRKENDVPLNLNPNAYHKHPEYFEQYVVNGKKAYDLENRKSFLPGNRFILNLSKKVIALNEHLKWLKSVKDNPKPQPTNAEQATSFETVNKPPNSDERLTLKDLFTVEDWQKYFDVLTMCEPPLLEKIETGYRFIGNQKNQKGIVASWAKYLKLKGHIKRSLNRDVLAMCLSMHIEDYTIAGSSIDNQSEKYRKDFEPQLKKLLNNN